MFATNVFFLNTLEETGQGFSNTDDLLYQMFRYLKSQEDEGWDFCVGTGRVLSVSMVWSLAACTGPVQRWTGQSMLLRALLKQRFKMPSAGIFSEGLCICCSHQLL